MTDIEPSQRWRSSAGETVVILNASIDEVEIYNFDAGLPTLTNCRTISVSELRASFKPVPQTSNWRKPCQEVRGLSVFTWGILAACCVVCLLAVEGEPENEVLVDCYQRQTQQLLPTANEVVLHEVAAKCQRGRRIDRVAADT